ncbi:hypothetical protein [Phenylobacterium sp.]|uniref:hypothetical protein n=1 Tax=Phenylobacterium sp. TaxID=1871053 RepID=UPI002FE2F1FA
MPKGGRRGAGAVAISAGLHAVLLVGVALHAPRLKVPPQSSAGAPAPIIPILLSPRAAPSTAGAPGGPIRLHRRQVRPRDLPAHVRPLVAPVAEAPATPSGPDAAGPPAPEESARRLLEAQDLARALRTRVGCSSPALLSREEREACDDRLAAGARDAPYLGEGLGRETARGLDAAAARKAADARYRAAPPTPPSAPGRAGSGQTAEGMAAQMGNDRGTLRAPF